MQPQPLQSSLTKRLTISSQSNQSFSQNQQNLELSLKKFNKIPIITNSYEIRLKRKINFILIFEITSQPFVQKDSIWFYQQLYSKYYKELSQLLNCQLYSRIGYTFFGLSGVQLSLQQQSNMKNIVFNAQIQSIYYNININLVKSASISDPLNSALSTQLFNIKMKNIVKYQCKMEELTKNVYFPKYSVLIQNYQYDVQARLGYKFTFSKQMKMFWEINHKIKVKRSSNLLQTYINEGKSPQQYIGKKVIKNYGNKTTFIIQSIDYTMNPLTKFDFNGKLISHKQYFQHNYKLTITDFNQPLIKSHSRYDYKISKKYKTLKTFKSQIYLIPQLVSLVGIPEYVNYDFLRQIKLTPNQSLHHNEQFLLEVQEKQQEFEIDYENCRGQAYVLPNPQIYINKYSKKQVNNGRFQVNTEISEPLELDDVLVVYSCKKYYNNNSNNINNQTTYNKDHQQSIQCIKLLQQSGKLFNIHFLAHYHCIQHFTSQSCLQKISSNISQHSTPQFIIILLKRHQQKYKQRIKSVLTYKYNVESQFIVKNKLLNNKNKMSIAGKICLQIAAKKNHQLWRVVQPKIFAKRKILVMGVSVQKRGWNTYYNNSNNMSNNNNNNNENNKFQCVITVNTNQNMSKIATYLFNIQSKQIPSQILQQVYHDSIKNYRKSLDKDKSQLTTIIIYRMGLNSNQKNTTQLMNKQIQILKDKLIKLNINPQVLYIKLTQRPTRRIFLQLNGSQSGSTLPRILNPQPGTFCFFQSCLQSYLISYPCHIGSSTPCLYQIIINTHKLSQKFIQQFNYSQCYMYYNWDGAVRLPAVAQYCKKMHKMEKYWTENVAKVKFSALNYL